MLPISVKFPVELSTVELSLNLVASVPGEAIVVMLPEAVNLIVLPTTSELAGMVRGVAVPAAMTVVSAAVLTTVTAVVCAYMSLGRLTHAPPTRYMSWPVTVLIPIRPSDGLLKSESEKAPALVLAGRVASRTPLMTLPSSTRRRQVTAYRP